MKTDNAYLAAKADVREAVLATLDRPIRVLDCFHGTGEVWREMRKRGHECDVTGVDIKPRTAGTIRMRADEALRRLTVERYNVFDLDAYGCPLMELSTLLHRLRPGPKRRVAIAWTWGYMGPHASVPRYLQRAIGWTRTDVRIPPPLLSSEVRAAIAGSWHLSLMDPETTVQYSDYRRCYTATVGFVGGHHDIPM